MLFPSILVMNGMNTTPPAVAIPFQEMLNLSRIVYYSDLECHTMLTRLERKVRNLTWAFQSTKDGKTRSDICRLGTLYETGGVYLDNDIRLLTNVLFNIPKGTEFATCLAANRKSYFQAFMASVPRHPVVLKSLELHVTYEREHGANPMVNAGTFLLREAMKLQLGRNQITLEHTGRYENFFLMKEVSIFRKRSPYCKSCGLGDLCGYFVQSGKSMVMQSRTYDKLSKKECFLYCSRPDCTMHKYRGEL